MHYTPPPRWRPLLAFGIAVLALGTALWIVVPPPTRALLALAVVAPEIALWILLLAVAAMLFAMPDRHRWQLSRVALAMAILAAGLAATPFARFSAAAHQADLNMTAALGTDFLRGVPADVRAAMRSGPLLPGELIGGIATGSSRITRGVTFATPAGGPLTLDVYQPTTDGPHPVIVQIYGGAWRSGTPDANATVARYLAGHGYVVVAPDYRHAPAWHWPTQLEDTRSALAWVREHAAEYGGDPSRLGLVGRSSGAQLALIAAYERGAPRVKAVVDLYGPVDLLDGWEDPPTPDPLGVRGVLEDFLNGTPAERAAAYRDASPLAYVTRPLPPTLLIYGGGDHVVRPEFGLTLFQRLRRSGTTTAFVPIPWAEHGFDAVPNGPSGQLALYEMERFLAWALRR